MASTILTCARVGRLASLSCIQPSLRLLLHHPRARGNTSVQGVTQQQECHQTGAQHTRVTHLWGDTLREFDIPSDRCVTLAEAEQHPQPQRI